ncbi:hypothetical protein [Arthrobacter sp. UYEF20]|uniref:hypothetical protein n=1 Tax=Arthrobacter sp. UYEF20 TaxID=1756363 RepID=UPI003394C278
MSPEVQFDETRRLAVRNLLVDNVRETPRASRQRMLAIIFVTAGSLGLGTAAFATAGQLGWIALPCSGVERCDPSYAPIPSWPLNDSGQT